MASENTSAIISKVWGLCNPLRDDGVSYGDYLEQLTYLIFLKMSDEYSKPPYRRETGIPKGYTWADMVFRMKIQSNRMPDDVFRVWTYSNLKVAYEIDPPNPEVNDAEEE